MRFRRQDEFRLGRDDALEVWLEVAANLGFLPGLRRIGGIRVDANDPLIESKREEHFGVAWRN
jgi:glycine/D-amino acid oxidase-like deaminating enzyme